MTYQLRGTGKSRYLLRMCRDLNWRRRSKLSAQHFAVREFEPSGKSEIFKDHEDMDAGAQANFIRAQGFDFVLYVTVLESGYVPEGVNTVSWNTPVMGFMFSGPRPAEWALKTKSELQDANTAKLVWSAETITSGIAEVSNMNLLFTQASQQIINKLGTDHII